MADKATFNPGSKTWRALRAALDTYRDEVDELQQANWTGDVVESMRRIRALAKLARGRSTDELEALAGLPPRRE